MLFTHNIPHAVQLSSKPQQFAKSEERKTTSLRRELFNHFQFNEERKIGVF